MKPSDIALIGALIVLLAVYAVRFFFPALLPFSVGDKAALLRARAGLVAASQRTRPNLEYAKKLPKDMKKAEEFIVSQNQAQNPEGEQTKQQPSLKEAGKKAELPDPWWGPNGLLRMLLVSALRMGGVGRDSRCQCIRSVGQYSVFAHWSSLGKSLYWELWGRQPG
jgi:hypothetical protein